MAHLDLTNNLLTNHKKQHIFLSWKNGHNFNENSQSFHLKLYIDVSLYWPQWDITCLLKIVVDQNLNTD